MENGTSPSIGKGLRSVAEHFQTASAASPRTICYVRYMSKVINPLKGRTDKSWFFEQQVYDEDGIARAIKSADGSGNIPKVIIYDKKQ